MVPLTDSSQLQPSRVLSPLDGMVAAGLEEQYFDIGRQALDLVLLSARLCDKPHYPDILDLPCGYGRVLRWLRAKYDYARITACDLEKPGVDFCAREFGAIPVYSQPDLRQLPFQAQFDLIWVGSLLTHLPLAQWRAALDCFVRWTRECGVLIFSTQGRCYTSLLARGRQNVSENIDKATLLDAFARDGFAYQPYFESKAGDYGVTVTSPAWLQGVLQRYPDLIMRAWLEEAWGMQDVVILYKKAGHYEPLLGLPEREPVLATPPAPARRLARWLGFKPGQQTDVGGA